MRFFLLCFQVHIVVIADEKLLSRFCFIDIDKHSHCCPLFCSMVSKNAIHRGANYTDVGLAASVGFHNVVGNDTIEEYWDNNRLRWYRSKIISTNS